MTTHGAAAHRTGAPLPSLLCGSRTSCHDCWGCRACGAVPGSRGCQRRSSTSSGGRVGPSSTADCDSGWLLARNRACQHACDCLNIAGLLGLLTSGRRWHSALFAKPRRFVSHVITTPHSIHSSGSSDWRQGLQTRWPWLGMCPHSRACSMHATA